MKQSFIPREKLSKKARQALDAQKRTQWGFAPVARVVPNKKKEAQAKKPRPGRYDAGWGVFLLRNRRGKSVSCAESRPRRRLPCHGTVFS